jgi:hypothetical protein
MIDTKGTSIASDPGCLMQDLVPINGRTTKRAFALSDGHVMINQSSADLRINNRRKQVLKGEV